MTPFFRALIFIFVHPSVFVIPSFHFEGPEKKESERKRENDRNVCAPARCDNVTHGAVSLTIVWPQHGCLRGSQTIRFL